MSESTSTSMKPGGGVAVKNADNQFTVQQTINSDASSDLTIAEDKITRTNTGPLTLEFLNPYMSHNKIRFIMWVFTVAGNAMFAFGLWILWIQFKNWRARRSAA